MTAGSSSIVTEAEVRQHGTELTTEVQSMKIVDQASYEMGGELLKNIVTKKKQAKEFMDPIVQKTNAAHKEATKQRKELLAPFETAEAILRPKISDYLEAERRKAEEEERKAREEAAKLEEEARLREAEALEKEGMKEEADAVLEMPVAPAPIVTRKEVPKVSGVNRTVTWDFEVVNELLIPREYLKVDTAKIGKYARAMGKDAKIVGVRIFQKTGLQVRG